MIRESFNSNWNFYKESGVNDSVEPVPITLPHDAMLLEKRDPAAKNSYNTGYFPGGVYHYLKTYFAPREFQQKNIIFEFEGVYMDSEVYINGQLAGGRPYGYSNFYVTADSFLKYGENNQIEVIVRNDKEPNSRWYSGSGIYRNVKIMIADPLHIAPDGVKLTTREVQAKAAVVEVLTSLVNNSTQTREVVLQTELREMHGETSSSDEIRITVNSGETNISRQLLTVQEPALWSVEAPNLYTCYSKIYVEEAVVDENIESFGIRTLELDPEHGLRLNGKQVKLRGGCVHHDNGVIGACTFEAAEERRVRILKECGFNAIRSAHNPLSKAMLQACDRLGMLVMDEFSDLWFRKKTKFDYSRYFRDWWERDIQAMVDKDYNHPCVIMYSIGNEISETASPEGVEYSRKLSEKVRDLDKSRFIINAINGWLSYFTVLQQRFSRKKQGSTFNEALANNQEKNLGAMITPFLMLINKFMDRVVTLPGIDRCTREAYATVDIAGYNYMTGRYEIDGKRYPKRIICGSETFPPDIVKNWRLVKKLPYLIGDFSWTAWDYLGEAGLCTWQYGGTDSLFKPYPCILADSSIIDITGHRQTQSYIHEIAWGLRTGPILAVQPPGHEGEKLAKSLWRGTNAIDSWTWPDCEGKNATVEVYADAAEVELILNGRSLGIKPAGDRHDFKAVYRAAYEPGELTAIAYDGERNEIGRKTLKTAGKQLELYIQSEPSSLKPDGADLAFIDIELRDESGIVHPFADRLVTLHLEGPGTLQGFGSANPFCEERYNDKAHTTFQGRALAVVRAGGEVGELQVTAAAEGCETRLITLTIG